MMDGGFPFTTEPNILTSMISKNTLLNDLMENIPIPGTMNIPLPMSLGGKLAMGHRSLTLASPSGVSAQLPRGTSSISPWRAVGVRYTTNEIYFDIIEELDAIIDKYGYSQAPHDLGLINPLIQERPHSALWRMGNCDG
jgi:AP-3 complex subunit mu